MDENIRRQPNPRRRRKTKMEIFRESYLPVIIVGAALILIIVFILGAALRGCSTGDPVESTPGSSEPITESIADPLEAEAAQLVAQAEKLALSYEFQAAIDLLDTFLGDPYEYPAVLDLKEQCQRQLSQMIGWSDPAQVVNLSFHGLIADASRAFADTRYGTAYNKNFVTTGEFLQILQQLYENDYVLVRLSDIFSIETNATGHTTCKARTVYLPLGKKPLIITQTNVNFYTYMTDSNGDGLADAGGDGFASRLIVDESGKLSCEFVTSAGETLTGGYDLVPILSDFIASHPDFSYKGARAVLAVSGYDGIFGYRINAEVKTNKGQEYYDAQVAGATEIVAALRAEGYELACYTYGNSAYGTLAASQIQAEMNKWSSEIAPILGETNILVFAQNSAISEYSGSKFNVLQNAGFRCYLDFASGRSGAQVGSTYAVHRRLLVTGSNMYNNPTAYSGMFDAAAILDSSRGRVPQ